MLRARSGDVTETAVVGDTALADMGQVIASAQTELNRLVQLGELQNDPIRYPLQALSVHLDALYKVTLAGSQTLARQIQVSKGSNLPVRDDEHAVIQAISVRAMGWHNALIGAGLLVAALMIGAAGGYWVRGMVPVLVEVRAGVEKCDDRPDGSRLCWLPLWERLPQTTSR